MEINKLTFDTVKTDEITKTFEELDVNGDEKITEADKTATNDIAIAQEINALLSASVDDEAELLDIDNNVKAKTSDNNDSATIGSAEYAVNLINKFETNQIKLEDYTIKTDSQGRVIELRQLGHVDDESLFLGTVYKISYSDNNEITIQDISPLIGMGLHEYTYNFEGRKIREYTENSSLGPDEHKVTTEYAEDGSYIVTTKDWKDNLLNIIKYNKDGQIISSTGTTGSTNTTRSTGATDTTDTGKYAELKAKLDAINNELASIDAQITTLSDANKVLSGQKEDLETEKADKERVLEEANNTLAREQETLKDYMNKYEQIQEDIKRVNNEILAEQEREAATYEDSVDSITNKAIEEYNPETDGDDFNAYLLRKLDQGGYAIFSDLDNLNSKANSLDSEAVTLLRNITSQTAVVQRAKSAVTAANTAVQDVTARLNDVVGKIQTNNDQIQGLEETKAAKETEKADVNKQIQELLPGGGLTAKEVLSKIPESEIALCKAHNIDLTKCKVAMGEDGIFHVYQENGTSVVRQYASGGGFSECADAYIKCGSGYISGIQEASEGSGRAVYTFSSVDCDWTDGECECMAGCYSTCSPLSFDVNGDGVKTSAETVSFDIDGDGVVDTVNNSAEWVLAFDKDHNGKAGENGSELFGDNTDLDGDGKADGYKNGFEALKALAQKEGLISATDTKLDENDIKFLQEKYGLTMTNGYGGEAKSLTDLGITEINLAQTDETTLTKNFDGRNNDIMTQEGATFTVNGQERDYADIWNAKKDKSEATDKDGNKVEEEQPFMPEVSMQQAKVTAKYGDKTLKLNDQRVIALEGKVEFEKIKNKIMAGAEVPKELLEEVIEIEDEDV